MAGDVPNNVEGGLQQAYCPIDVIVTVLVLTAGRETMKVAVIGRGGMSGVPILTRLILRFAQTPITKTAQNAVCSRHQLVEQQLCTWLLTCMDYMPTGTTLPVTQEIVAGLLGVRLGAWAAEGV